MKTLFSLLTLSFTQALTLKERYSELNDLQVWQSKLVPKMDSHLYDTTVADPWFGVQPFL